MIDTNVVDFISMRNQSNSYWITTLIDCWVQTVCKNECVNMERKTNAAPLTDCCVFSYSCHVIVAHKFRRVIIHVADRYIYIAHSNKSTIVSLYKLRRNRKSNHFSVCTVHWLHIYFIEQKQNTIRNCFLKRKNAWFNVSIIIYHCIGFQTNVALEIKWVPLDFNARFSIFRRNFKHFRFGFWIVWYRSFAFT